MVATQTSPLEEQMQYTSLPPATQPVREMREREREGVCVKLLLLVSPNLAGCECAVCPHPLPVTHHHHTHNAASHAICGPSGK